MKGLDAEKPHGGITSDENVARVAGGKHLVAESLHPGRDPRRGVIMLGHWFKKADGRPRRDRHVRPKLERCEPRISLSGFAAAAVQPASAAGIHEIIGALIRIN